LGKQLKNFVLVMAPGTAKTPRAGRNGRLAVFDVDALENDLQGKLGVVGFAGADAWRAVLDANGRGALTEAA